MEYCEQAADLISETEHTSPYATQLLRKGLLILDRKLKSLLEEIQEKAKTACRESQGTDTEEIACAVSREVQKWEIGSQEEMGWYVENLVLVLKSKIPHTPENREILERIESLKSEKNLTKQYSVLPIIIGLIPTVNVVSEEDVT